MAGAGAVEPVVEVQMGCCGVVSLTLNFAERVCPVRAWRQWRGEAEIDVRRSAEGSAHKVLAGAACSPSLNAE